MANLDAITVQAPGPILKEPVRFLWQVQPGSDGLVVVRSAFAPEPDPADWHQRLAWFIRNIPGVVMAGAKRFDPQGHVFSLGEFVIHPKGFHHHGKGTGHECYRFPEECDTIAGGVAVIDRKAFDQVNGQALLDKLGPLGMLGLGLALRQRGGRVLACPQAAVTDTLSPDPADRASRDAFASHFGFDWVAPDLKHVREQHAGKGLLWNACFHAGMMPFAKYDDRGGLCWEGYKVADVFRERAHKLASLIATYAMPPNGDGGLVLDVGSGDGLFTHLFARAGCTVIGIDPEPTGVETATNMCATHEYPESQRPQFRVGSAYDIPFQDNTATCVSLFDVIEHLDNPIAAINEIARVLKPGGHFVCVTPAWQFGASSDPAYHGFEFNEEEFSRLVNAGNGLTVATTGKIKGVYRDLIVIAKKA